MLTTALHKISSIRAISRLLIRSGTELPAVARRSPPQFINKLCGRSYATKRANNITNIFKNDRTLNTSIFGTSEQYRKYSNNKSETNKPIDAEQLDEADNNEEEIPLLEINESYLDTQKHNIESVLRRDLQARDVKVYDFRDLNLTSNCGVSFEIEVWCAEFKDKTLLQQHRMVIDTLQCYNKTSSTAKEQLLDIDNFHSIVIRTHV